MTGFRDNKTEKEKIVTGHRVNSKKKSTAYKDSTVDFLCWKFEYWVFFILRKNLLSCRQNCSGSDNIGRK